MIYKTHSPLANHIRVTFELPNSLWADQIFLVGEFNKWDPTHTPFIQARNGFWRATIDLPVGTSTTFRYLIDGNWYSEFHADGSVADNSGFHSNIVQV